MNKPLMEWGGRGGGLGGGEGGPGWGGGVEGKMKERTHNQVLPTL